MIKLTIQHFEVLEFMVGGFHIDESDTIDSLYKELTTYSKDNIFYLGTEDYLDGLLAIADSILEY